MAKRFFTFLLLFIGFTLIFQSVFPKPFTEESTVEDLTIAFVEKNHYSREPLTVVLTNHLDRELSLPSDCPSEPFRIERYKNGLWETLSAPQGLFVACEGKDRPAGSVVMTFPKLLLLSPETPLTFSLSPWKDELFRDIGKYRLSIDLIDGSKKSFTQEFDIVERGFFSSISYQFFFRPIFNVLIYLVSVLPSNNLGLAVILLTILIRFVLLVPNQKALKSQRMMLRIQPELDEIKRKYKGDQQKISLETMALWKKHRVSPIGGCLPLLIQIPILIALFYVVRTGFTPYEGYHLYPFLSSFDLSKVNSDFYGILNLQEINATWLPIFVGLLQYAQMKMSLSRFSTGPGVLAQKHKMDATAALQDPLLMMNKSMTYFMPIMILLMVASLPSGVGLYLAVSTLFGIVQQFTVNRATASPPPQSSSFVSTTPLL